MASKKKTRCKYTLDIFGGSKNVGVLPPSGPPPPPPDITQHKDRWFRSLVRSLLRMALTALQEAVRALALDTLKGLLRTAGGGAVAAVFSVSYITYTPAQKPPQVVQVPAPVVKADPVPTVVGGQWNAIVLPTALAAKRLQAAPQRP